LTSVLVAALYARPKFPLAKLRDLVCRVQYGISALATEEKIGTPMIRMNNLQDDGWDFSDLKYIELPPEETKTYRLESGDILFNRTNSKELVGKCEVFREAGEWVYASYLIRVCVDTTKALPDFISAFLNTKAGRSQIDRVSRQIVGMSNVNAEELRELVIPLPSLEIQQKLVAEFESQRLARQQKLAEADALLAGLEPYLFSQLGLTRPPADPRQVFAVRLKDFAKERLDADYYRPRFVQLLQAICKGPHKPLGAIIGPSHEQWNPDKEKRETFRYIEISDVDRKTGEVTAEERPVADAPSRARMLTQQNDLIVSLTRPHHGSIALIDEKHDGCICSTGFAVLRQRIDESVSREYLLCILRSSLCLDQMLQRSSGGNYPAITEDELLKIEIPLPLPGVQQQIIAEQSRRRMEARRLRAAASTNWLAAKKLFEEKLLGGVA
jgi:restriction endonuclease S subunit